MPLAYGTPTSTESVCSQPLIPFSTATALPNGSFSCPLFCRSQNNISITTWNARALSHLKTKIRHKKLRYLDKLLKSSTITFVQESHGSRAEIERLLYHYRKSFYIFHACGPDRGTGGTITFVDKSFFGNVSSTVIVEGRASRTVVDRDGSKVILYNIHNFGLTGELLDLVFDSINQDRQLAKDDPSKYTVVIGGDFNNFVPGEAQQYLNFPTKEETTSRDNGRSRLWNEHLGHFTELHQRFPTHFAPGSLAMGRIDRLYTSVPPWMLTNTSSSCAIVDCSKWLFEQGISDHSPVRVSLTSSAPMPKQNRPIPKYVFEHSSFTEIHDQLAEAAKLDERHVVDRWQLHKIIIKEAARIVRNSVLQSEPDSVMAKSQTFATAARCVWQNDISLAMNLIHKSPLIAEHIQVRNGTVTVIDSESFDLAVRNARQEFYDARHQELEALKHKKKKKQQTAAIDRLRKLWLPLGSKFCLSGVRIGSNLDGSPRIVTEPRERAAALSKHWASVFSVTRPINAQQAQQVLNQHAKPFDFSAVTPPDIDDYARVLRSLPHSAPGPDGIPYAGWNAAGWHGAKSLFLVGGFLMSGHTMPLDFNDSLSAFVPKGSDDLDEVLISRDATDTRPLSMKNSDNKTVGSVFNDKMKPVLSKQLCKLQRGFVPGEQLIENVLDLDTASRIHGMQSSAALKPILALWDFAAAFPSVLHAWIFMVIRAYEFPGGAQNLINAMYFMNHTYLNLESATVFLFVFLSGVLQGCPLSGMLFDVALDPFLRWFDAAVRPDFDGVIRACADDIGGSLARLEVLKSVFPIFETAREVAGLTLKPAKCIIVPLYAKFSAHIVETIRLWLHAHIPQWSKFQIKPTAKYLGFWLGPAANTMQWTEAGNKWLGRGRDIADAKYPASVTAREYNVKAVPVLSFLSQLLEVPSDFIQKETHLLHRLLHAPGNAFDKKSLHNLQEFGGPELKSIKAVNIASLVRTATKTIPNYRVSFGKLKATAERFVPYADFFEHIYWGYFWDSKALVCNLANAVDEYFGQHPRQVTDNRVKAVQKQYYEQVLPALYPRDLCGLFERRLSTLFPQMELEIKFTDWQRIFKQLKRCSTHISMCVAKTYVNAWATTHRYHEQHRLTCILGCKGADDTLAHYIDCPRLWRVIAKHSHEYSRGSVLEKLGLRNAHPERFKNISVAFTVYHALKMGHRELIESALRTRQFHQLAEEAKRQAAVANNLMSSLIPK